MIFVKSSISYTATVKKHIQRGIDDLTKTHIKLSTGQTSDEKKEAIQQVEDEMIILEHYIQEITIL